jgi:hypothetical protein
MQRRGLRYLLTEFLQPGVREANGSENPFTTPLDVQMMQEVVEGLSRRGDYPRPGKSLPPRFAQEALERTYRKIELELVHLLVVHE